MKFNTYLQLLGFENEAAQQTQQAQQMQPIQGVYSQQPQVAPIQQMMDDEANVDPQLNFLMSMYQENPSIINDPEVAAALAPLLNQQQQQQQQPVPQNTQQRQSFVQQQQVQQAHTQQTTTDGFGRQVASVDNQDDFVNNTGIFKKKEVDYNAVTLETLPEVIAQRHGIDTSKEDWLPTFLKAVDTHRKNATEKSKYETQVTTYMENLKALPLPVQMAIDAALKGGDWRNAVNQYDIDYNKDFDTYTYNDKLNLVRKYMPTAAISETTPESDPIAQSLLAAAKVQYNANKTAIKQNYDAMAAREAAKVQEYSSAINNSLTTLQQRYPDEFQEDDLKGIQNIMVQGFDSLFYDESGKLLPDAAERVAYVLYGKNLIDRISSRKGTNKANEQLAQVLATQQSRGAGSASQNVTQPNNPDIQSLQGLLTSMQPTY